MPKGSSSRPATSKDRSTLKALKKRMLEAEAATGRARELYGSGAGTPARRAMLYSADEKSKGAEAAYKKELADRELKRELRRSRAEGAPNHRPGAKRRKK